MFICFSLQLVEKTQKGRQCLLCVPVTSTMLDTLQILNKVHGNSGFNFQSRLGSYCTKCLLEVISEYNSFVVYDENRTVHRWESMLTSSR